MVEWLECKPDDIDLNERYFAVLDKGARDDPPTIVICRIGDLHTEQFELILMRKPVIEAIDQLIGAAPVTWREYARQGGKAEIKYDDDEQEG